MKNDKTEEMSLNEAWNLIGAACLAYKDEKVRHALMLVRADVAEKNLALQGGDYTHGSTN